MKQKAPAVSEEVQAGIEFVRFIKDLARESEISYQEALETVKAMSSLELASAQRTQAMRVNRCLRAATPFIDTFLSEVLNVKDLPAAAAVEKKSRKKSAKKENSAHRGGHWRALVELLNSHATGTELKISEVVDQLGEESSKAISVYRSALVMAGYLEATGRGVVKIRKQIPEGVSVGQLSNEN